MATVAATTQLLMGRWVINTI